MKNKLKEKSWYPFAVAGCLTVTLYVVLTHLGPIAGVIGKFTGYFDSVIIGVIFAYLMNPLAKLYQRKIFGRVAKEKLRWTLSVVLTLVTAVVVLILMLEIFIPQLADSIATLYNNMDSYIESLEALLAKLGLGETLKLDAMLDSLFGPEGKFTTLVKNNVGNILNASAAAGKVLLKWVIAFILSAYMLMSKSSMKSGLLRLMHAVFPEKAYNSLIVFLTRCDNILVNYVVCSLLDSAIVGAINLAFMTILGMEYAGLISLLAALTNLIPTFGPFIGGAIGGFILLLVKPMDALIFVIFTVVLQFLDGYVIKPKLFGDKLGVSGLLILASIIVCGNIWGILGILLAIPIAAILDFVYEDVLLPALEKHREKVSAKEQAQEQ
jgi:predicted PurR-regulated permease PerM